MTHQLSKTRFVLSILTAVLITGVTVTACAGEKKVTPPAPTPAGQLSFPAKEYANTEYGFSLKYPEEWQEQQATSPTTVFYVASPSRVPVLNVFVIEGATLADAFTAAAKDSGSDIEFVSQKESTLADGTPATEAKVKWKVRGMSADTFILGTKKGAKWFIVSITTVAMIYEYNEPFFSEIAHTLEFKAIPKAEPASTEAQPPTIPAAPAQLSFAAKEYSNTTYGFSIKYPKDWKEEPVSQPTTVLSARAPAVVPILNVLVIKGSTIEEAFVAAMKNRGSGIQFVSKKETALSDGTPATEAVVKWTVQDMPADSYVLGTYKSDKWFIVSITTVSTFAKYNEPLFSEIARTLEFK